MREIQLPLSEAKQRLLDAAEALFAERGFELVSVRDVTQQAKANVAAINYHFGTRDGLIGWVVARHLPSINDERLARLENLERKGGTSKTVPVEEILDAFVRPVAGSVRKSGLSERLSCQLLGRIFALQGDELPPALNDQRRGVIERFTRALGKSLPEVALEEWIWRLNLVVGALSHLLIHPEWSDGVGGAPPLDSTLSRFIRFASAGLREGERPEAAANKKGPQAVFDFG